MVNLQKAGLALVTFPCLFLALHFRGQIAVSASGSYASLSGKFSDVTSALGVHFEYRASHTEKKYLLETMGPGVALFDYDNDGRLDIFVVNGAPLSESAARDFIPQKTGPDYWNRLYHQKQDGTFEDVTEKAGLQGIGYGMGVAVGDYDNDGYEDLYVTAYGGNRLYHNNGNGTFSDVTEQSGVGGSGWSSGAAWIDLDNDGLLDLVVLRYLKWDFRDIFCGEHREGYRAYCHPDLFPPVSPLIYHNDGNGHFSDISEKSGLAKPGKGLGVGFADYDRDGYADIFIANDSMPEFLFHNQRNGTFQEVGLMSGVAVDAEGNSYAGMGIDFADYNNDGLPDIVVTDLAMQKYALYQNIGGGNFNYVTPSSGLGRISQMHSGWGVKFIDYDNDGWKDLLIAQGHDLDTIELQSPQLRYREPMLLAHNTGGKFVDVSPESGAVFHEPWVGRGLATGDIDNDGRVDAVVTTNDGPVHILHNETKNLNHWLTLKLVGHKSNRDGMGAEVEVVTAGHKQLATVTTAGSYLSASDKRVHFGLGEDRIAQVNIHWPSGTIQTLTDVACDKELQVDEPVGHSATPPVKEPGDHK
jgi:hypothetical protein